VPFFADKTFIMFNGRPTPHKNMRRLIEAFAILHPKYPDLYLMLAGKKDGSYDSYVTLIDKLGLANCVIMTDFIPDGQLRWAMSHCKAYVWASLSEGFGLPPLEAMLNSAPVASSNASCSPEVNGDAAEYFDPYDVKDMARVIERVMDDEALRAQLIARGHEQVKKYSWQRMAEQTLAVYRRVLDEV
jgi:glycosyltransferase involved in cell wall biosynthesis